MSYDKKEKKSVLVGMTGQTGAGKTTAAESLRSLGFAIINADEVAHRVLAFDDVMEDVLTEFGTDILNDTHNRIDRKKLADCVFSSYEKLEILNKITHPVIREEILKQYQNSNSKFVLLDAPTLIESGLNEDCDVIVSVIADDEIRLERIMKRDNLNIEHATARMKSQADDFFYISHSDLIIKNNYDDDHLNMLTSHLFHYLQNIY